MTNILEQILNAFDTIALEQVGKVSFLKRCDFKYVMSVAGLMEVLLWRNETMIFL